MARLEIPTRDQAPREAKGQLDAIAAKLGRVPNFFRVLAISPPVLTGYATLATGLARTLDLRTRERIALTVSQINECDYCLAAHSYTALNFAHLSPEDIAQARRGTAPDAKVAAALAFARRVAEQRGKISDTDFRAVKDAGFDETEIVEIVAVVAQTFLTNLINNVVATEVDFPATVTASEPATAG